MSKSVKMRDRKSESSSRLVQCYYCGVEKKLKDLRSHCENAHGKPLRQKGQLSLSESFFKPDKPHKPHKPAKRAKTTHQKNTSQLTRHVSTPNALNSAPEGPEEEPVSPSMSSIVKQLTGMLLSLVAFLNPLKAIVRSLETSSKRMKDSFSTKRNEVEKREHQLSTIHHFHCDHRSKGLIVSNSGTTAIAYCLKCMKFGNDIRDVPYFDSDWTVNGKKLTKKSGKTMVAAYQLSNA